MSISTPPPPDTKGADPFAKSNASNLTIHTMPAYLSSYKQGVWAKYNVVAEYTLPVSGSGWKIDEKGVLTLTSMPVVAYGSAEEVPWHNYREMITAVKAAPNVTITAVGDYWFSDMDKLDRVDFQIIGRVGKYAFDGCTNLKHLLILSVTSVSDGAFSECKSLDVIAFDASLKTLGQSVFYGCDNLREIWLKDSWTPPTVTAKTFQGLDQSKVTVHVPSADITDYVQADYWKQFKFTMEGNVVGYSDIMAAGTFYDSYFILQGDGTLSCFAQDHTKNASQTASALSQYKNKVNSIVIYGDITSLGAIFKDFTSLQEVKLPDNLVELNGTFEGCSKLTDIQLPSGLNIIGSNTFKNCVGLHKINVLFVSKIGSYAFQNSGVEEIATLADIEQGAFQGCKNLKEVQLCSRVIPANLFNNCPALTTVLLTYSVRSFEDNAFKGTNLKDIYYFSPSPGVRNYSGIETEFSGFQAAGITLHVPQFAEEVFNHYSPWKYMQIVEDDDYQFTKMGSLYNAEPQSWWLIGLNGELNIVPEEDGVAQMSEWQNANDYLYNPIDPWMPYISSVRISSDFVNTIDNLMPNDRYVLEGGVTSITLGANMQHVGKSFNQLYNLEHVYCKAHQVPEIDSEAFDWKVVSDNSVTLHVLKSVGVNAYRANTYWKKFRIVADLADTYSVTVLTPEHGQIICQEDVDLNDVPAGTTLHFAVIPDDGYRLVQWHNYDADNGLTVNADCTIGAIFAPISDGIEDIEIDQFNNGAASRKVLIDGRIYIIRNGHIYNLHGMRVK
ncbi:MAG: leucine-rich repeat protein [Paludibacteraceae bacterium]|nr:leucine-rich repeat protein [Paludibacteraceae bacterium]